VTDSTTLALVVLLVLLIVTRPGEERLWKSGRLSDRAAAWLIVGRLIVLAVGFGLIVGSGLPGLVLLSVLSAIAAIVLQPIAQRRIAGLREQDRTGKP
jgi:hypothetical protein